MRDILAFATSFSAWDGSVAYAADLAARVDGALTGAYVHPSPLYMMPPYASPDLLEAVIENAREIERIAHAAEASFVAWAGTIGARRAAWQVAEGHVPETLAHIGNWHDLLVIERNPDAPSRLGHFCATTPCSRRKFRIVCQRCASNFGVPERCVSPG